LANAIIFWREDRKRRLTYGDLLLAALFSFLAAEFPDDAAWAKLAVQAGVGAGAASVQAFLAVPQFMFLALYAGLPLRMKSAGIHKVIIAKI
jgi:hypothetical protein